MSEHEQVVHENEVDPREYEPDEAHTFERKQLGAAAGSEDLGVSRYSIPAGNRTWHRHYHTANEEGLYVLEGGGTLSLGPDADEVSLTSGIFVALPTDERGAHAVQAGEEGLELLVFSTMNEPDVAVYPDEDMVGLFVGAPPGGDGEKRTLPEYLDLDCEREYWE